MLNYFALSVYLLKIIKQYALCLLQAEEFERQDTVGNNP